MSHKLISILHADLKYGIGKNNGLVFSLPEDMKFFRTTTKGHVVAMGENTLLSFPNSKPLKNRTNIVLSQDASHNYEGCVNAHSFDDFLLKIKGALENDDVYIIGGASIYKQTLPYVDEILLTRVHEIFDADVFFPDLEKEGSFVLVSESEPIIDNGHKITFCVYKRK